MDSRIPDYAFEPPYRVRRCSLAPSVSTNSTASNLPGPGRTLGLGYEIVGKHIEIQLGRFAEMLGKGPRKTAIRIERRRSKVVGLPAGSRKIKDKNAKIEKDCGHLLQYAQSSVASTKLQALDHITRFAVEDEFVRDVLLAKDAVSIIDPLQLWDSTWIDFSPTLLTSSRKALLSLVDTEVNIIAQEIAAMIGESKIEYFHDRLHRIQSYFRDPDRAFLVVRHLERLYVMALSHKPPAPDLGNFLLNFIADFDECFSRHFEWNVLDKLIVRYTNAILLDYRHVFFTSICGEVTVPIMELIVRDPERLPQTVGSSFFSWFSAFDNKEYDIDLGHAQVTFCLLRGIANTSKLDMNACLRIDSAVLQGLYPHPVVQPLLCRLTCPPEILLCQIIAIKHRFKYIKYFGEVLTPIVMESEELEHLYTQLSQYVDSEDELTCQRALHAFKYLLSTDIYCRRASLRALSATGFAQTMDFRLLVEESEKKCIPASVVDRYSSLAFTRHYTNSGELLHICINYWACCNGTEGTKQILEFPEEGVLELHIRRGISFSAAGHLPLLAAVTATGGKAYIAQPVSKSGKYGEYIAVTEGTKPEDLRMWEYAPYPTKRKVVPLYLVVYVLRYAPDAYMRCDRFAQQASDDELGLDATGPYSWKTIESDQAMYKGRSVYYDSDDEDYQASISEGEEEVADDEVEDSSIAEQESTDEEWETPNEWESVDITLD